VAAYVQIASQYNTTGGNRTATITPAVNGLLVVCAGITGIATEITSITDDRGGTYTKAAGPAFRAGGSAPHSIYVRDSLVTSAVLHSVLMTSAGGDNGGGLAVLEFSGMTKTGATAVRSFGAVSNQAAAGTPAVTLSNTPLTANPCVAANFQASNSVITPPASFTERFDAGFTSPTAAMEIATVDSGFTSATITWGSTSTGAFGAAAVELDSSAAVTVTKTPKPLRVLQAVNRSYTY